jgi:UDP-galactopyranose mutase
VAGINLPTNVSVVGAEAALDQRVGTVNYPNDHDYTRITEFKHLPGQAHAGTSIVREYPQAEGDPYYPVPRPENEFLFKRYEALALKEHDVTFVGRLAQYRYYNMDQCVGAALKAAEYVLEKIGHAPAEAMAPLVDAGSNAAVAPPLIAKH